MEKKVITASINLPVECVDTILNVCDPDVIVPIQKAIEFFNSSNPKNDEDEGQIKSMNSIVTIPDGSENVKFIPPEMIDIEHSFFNIVNIEKRPIEKTNEIRFFKLSFEFSTGIVKTYTVPSFVKFYSVHTGSFVPAEFIRNRHILLDYTGKHIKATDATQIEDFKMTNYYNIKVAYEIDERLINSDGKVKPNTCNFYLNEIFTNVSYNNFQIKNKEE